MTSPEPIRGAFYARVSGHKQKKDDTIQTQLDVGLGWCQQNGVLIAPEHIYLDEDVVNSVPYDERPGARPLFVAAARGEFEVVVCYKSSRLSRTLELFEEGRKRLLAARVALKCIKSDIRYGNAAEKLSTRVQLVVDEWDRDNQQENLHAGKRRVAAAGAYTGGGVTYCYTLTGSKPTRYAIYEPEATIMRRAYGELVADLSTCYQICQRFNAEGIPRPSDSRPEIYRARHRRPEAHEWTPEVLAKLLGKTIYKGSRRYRDADGHSQFAPVPHLAIVSEALWEAAQRRLAENMHHSRRNARREYLLSGKLYCAAHEQCMIGCTREADSPGGTASVAYRCQRRDRERRGFAPGSATPCARSRVPAAALEAVVWSQLEAYLRDCEGTALALLATEARAGHRQAELETALAAVEQQAQRQQTIRSAAMRGLSLQGWPLAPEDSQRAYHEARTALAALDPERAALLERLAGLGRREARLHEVEGHLRYWHERLDHLSFRAKKHLIGLFVDRIWVREDGEGVYFEVTFCFEPPAGRSAENEAGVRVFPTPLSARWRGKLTAALRLAA